MTSKNEFDIMVRADWFVIGFTFGFITGVLLSALLGWWLS